MSTRQQHIERLSSEVLDVLVVGGGINGAASAAALASREISVGLIDSRDFAGFTSQQSSNLIWGGIKYLESYDFALVSRLCKARNTLMRHYPSQVRELRFLACIPGGFRRHPLLVWAGAWLYWLMGRGYTRIPRYRSRASIKHSVPVVQLSACRAGVEYSDAYLPDNDARFVFGFVRKAVEQGAHACNYLKAESAVQGKNRSWVVQVHDQLNERKFDIRCRAVINATGAFADGLNANFGIKACHRHTFSKGIHLIVPKIMDAERVLAFFADDGRPFFAIPMGSCTCIGTTDTRVSQPYTEVTEADRDFVLENINARLELARPLERSDIVAERCGVRPLVFEPGSDEDIDFLQLSRKHVIETFPEQRYLSLFGGKLTDCISVGEEVLHHIGEMGVANRAGKNVRDGLWYGEPDPNQRSRYCERAIALQLDRIRLVNDRESLMSRLWRRYGLDAFTMLDAIEKDRNLATPLIEGASLYRCELQHLAQNEMVTSLQDLLHRRTRVGLLVPREQLRESEGIRELCRVVFGEEADEQYAAYFRA